MNALVLGGGGPVGAAWTAGLLHGLIGAGVPVAESDVVVGTSAGAVVGAWLTMRPSELLTVPEVMRERAAWHVRNAEAGRRDHNLTGRMLNQLGQTAQSPRDLAQAAIAAIPPISTDEAIALWQQFLPDGAWSPRFRAVAVNADTGLAHAWSAEDGIPVPVGVACSTAAPGVAPPVTVAGAAWVDGGVRSATNADLIVELSAPGRALVVSPMPSEDITRERADLEARGYQVRVIVAEPFYRTPLDLLDAGFIDAGRDAGARQAVALAKELLA
ncbi:MAG TPA: patatin-like phospholipase family protein [Pseudonocardiaceae bacterium]|jgi:NTE family protein